MTPKQILYNFLTYACTALFIRGMTFMITPITMRVLTPTDYGKMSLINSFVHISTALCGLGLRQAIALEYFHVTSNARTQLITDIILTYSLLATPVLLCSIMGRETIAHYLFAHELSSTVIALSMTLVFISFFSELFYQILKYEQRARQLTALYVLIACISTGATLLLLWHFNTGYASIVYGQLIGAVCATSIGIRSYKVQSPITLPSKATISHYLALGAPFIPSLLCTWLLASGDKLMLARYSTLHNVGIYSIADSLCQLFTILILQPWNSSYLPYILKTYTENQHTIPAIEHKNQQLMWRSMLAMLILILAGFYLSKPLLCIILPPNYQGALNYILLLLIGSLFLYGAHCASALIQFYKKSYFLACALTACAALNIILNRLLIPSYAIYGCVWATVISYFCYFMITLVFNRYLLRQ